MIWPGQAHFIPYRSCRFKKAFQKLVATTYSLRSTIQESDWVPQQVFLSEMPYAFQHLDFSRHPQPQAQFEKWLNEKPLQTFEFDPCLFETILLNSIRALTFYD